VSTKCVLLTEGYIKGRVLANRLGRVTLSVVGANNTAKVVATLNALGDVEEVWLAYDRDSATKRYVAAAETKIVREITAAGYAVKQLDWPAEYGNGLDDALQAGVIPVAVPHPALAEQHHNPEPRTAPTGQKLAESQVQRDAAVFTMRARARIQRNSRLPARPMANVVVGVMAQAATASNPAGPYADRVAAGFVLAPVRELSLDAGTTPANGGKQLDKLDAAGLIVRHAFTEHLPPGGINPETGEILSTPHPIVRHFIAVAGHEHERVTSSVVRDLVDRMAEYDSGTPERRGGRRTPRCPEHPNAEVVRTFVDTCAECERVLNDGAYPLPAMRLEPAATSEQTLHERGDASEPEEEQAINRDSPVYVLLHAKVM
jgi:Domain of unknown function (DUF3854)